jgi:hypothetical protein
MLVNKTFEFKEKNCIYRDPNTEKTIHDKFTDNSTLKKVESFCTKFRSKTNAHPCLFFSIVVEVLATTSR